MKNKILLFITAILGYISAQAADGDSFTAKTVEGVDMKFQVINENDKTVAVSSGDNHAAIYIYHEGNITIPDSVLYNGSEYKVVSIGDYAFAHCYELISVDMPSNITSIGDYAFYLCHKLTSLEIPSSVIEIGNYAFSDCSGLTSIYLPNNVTSIGEYIFSGSIQLTSINIPSSITTIPRGFFSGTGISSIEIPSHIKTISPCAFESCALSSVVLSEGLEEICDSAFLNCQELAGIRLPSTLKEIGINAFMDFVPAYIVSKAIEPPVCSHLICDPYCYNGNCTLFVPKGTKEKYQEVKGWMFDNIVDSIPLPAYDFMVDDVAYKVLSKEDKTVEVVQKDDLLWKCSRELNNYGYKGHVVIPSTVNHNGTEYQVISVHENALTNNRDIESVVVSKGIKVINLGGCTNLKSVILPEGIETIPDYGFCGCAFSEINIPSTVTSIGAFAFLDCVYLTSIDLPDNITSSSVWFQNCSRLKRVKLPKKLSWLKNYAFNGCSQLEEVIFPDSLQGIEQYCFKGCSRLPHIELPECFRYLDYNVFSGCTGLAYIHLKSEKVFYLDGGTFPDEVYENAILFVNKGMKQQFEQQQGWARFKTIIEGEPDKELRNYKSYFEVDGLCYNVTSIGKRTVELVCSEEGYEGTLIVPATVHYRGITYTVTSVDHAMRNDGFIGDVKVTSITLPNTITSIGSECFEHISRLEAINIPESVTKIGSSAFSGTGLTTIEIPNSVTIIGGGAFGGCSSLSTVILGNGIKRIYTGTFSGCGKLTSITLPANLTKIDDGAFRACYSLPAINLPEGLEYVGNYAFYNCSSLQSLFIPSMLTNIKQTAFMGCTGLERIQVAVNNSKYDSRNNCNAMIETATDRLVLGCRNTVIPRGVKAINDYAFYDCDGLKNISIPDGVTSIGASTFYGCSELKSIALPQSLNSIGNFAFMGCPKLENITIPNNIDSIGAATFRDCESLKSVSLPENISYIGWNAFQNCKSLTEINIPESAITLGPWAFEGCDKLQSVKVKAKLPYYIDAQAFLRGFCEPIETTDISDMQIKDSLPEDGFATVYSTDGRIVRTIRVVKGKFVDDELPSSGTYIIKIGEQSKKIFYQKINN